MRGPALEIPELGGEGLRLGYEGRGSDQGVPVLGGVAKPGQEILGIEDTDHRVGMVVEDQDP